MLFLLRPRQTYMPYTLPLRAGAPAPAPEPQASGPDVVARLQELAELHESGKLTDEEFAAAKRAVLG